jgi:hypothetical protein
MAFFDVTSNGTTDVTIAAASTGNRARILAIGFSNSSTSAGFTVKIYDGPSATGTLRVSMTIPVNTTRYDFVQEPGQSVFPKGWFTAGNAITFILSGAGTTIRIFGELVM